MSFLLDSVQRVQVCPPPMSDPFDRDTIPDLPAAPPAPCPEDAPCGPTGPGPSPGSLAPSGAFLVAPSAREDAPRTSYARLRDGTWGVRVPYPVGPGQRVPVVTRAGAIRTETIALVVWHGTSAEGQVYLCATEGGIRRGMRGRK